MKVSKMVIYLSEVETRLVSMFVPSVLQSVHLWFGLQHCFVIPFIEKIVLDLFGLSHGV